MSRSSTAPISRTPTSPPASSSASQPGGLLSNFNAFEGRAGNDNIVGNGGTRIEFTGATGGIVANLVTGIATGDASVGTDTFTGVNSVRATQFADTLLGGNPLLNGFESFEGRARRRLHRGRTGLRSRRVCVRRPHHDRHHGRSRRRHRVGRPAAHGHRHAARHRGNPRLAPERLVRRHRLFRRPASMPARWAPRARTTSSRAWPGTTPSPATAIRESSTRQPARASASTSPPARRWAALRSAPTRSWAASGQCGAPTSMTC